jgi:hypothetical protein
LPSLQLLRLGSDAPALFKSPSALVTSSTFTQCRAFPTRLYLLLLLPSSKQQQQQRSALAFRHNLTCSKSQDSAHRIPT